MLDNIVSAMMELDQNNVKNNFGARDILTLLKGDPRDLVSYAMLERLMVLKEKIWCMENGLNENAAEVINQKEYMNDVVNTLKTHDTLLKEKIVPVSPTYAGILSAEKGPHNTMPILVQEQPNGIKSGKQDAAASTHHGLSKEQVNGVSEHNRGQWTVIGKNGKIVPANSHIPRRIRESKVVGKVPLFVVPHLIRETTLYQECIKRTMMME